MSSEKRKERRIKVNLPVRIVYQDKCEIPGTIENISRLGAYAVVGTNIPEGTNVSAIFAIPAYPGRPSLEEEVRAQANVFRVSLIKESGISRDYGTGLFFTKFLNQKHRDKLSGYIDFLIRQEEDSIKVGVKHWQEKRETARKERQARDIPHSKGGAQTETLVLLERIMARLDEIHALLKRKNN